jgi:hypothetical protein
MKHLLKSVLIFCLFTISLPLLIGQNTYKTFGEAADSSYSFYSAVSANDGGLLHVGAARKAASFNLYIVKTNAAGQVIWQRNYMEYTIQGYLSVVNNGSSGYTIFGGLGSGTNSQVFFMNVSENGNVTSLKKYGNVAFRNISHGNLRLKDGSFILSTSELNVSQHTTIIYKFNNIGDTLWSKRYTQFTGYGDGDLVQLSDKGFMTSVEKLSGNLATSHFFKIDSSGNFQWLSPLTDSILPNL